MSNRKIANLPNLLTAMRIVLTPIFLVVLFADVWYGKGVAFLVFAVASLTDFYDGRLARAGNQVTAVGRFLDPLADKILVLSALIAFVFDKLVSVWLVLPIVARDLAIMGLRIYGLSTGRQMATSRFAKWKTAIQLFTVVFLLFLIGAHEAIGHLAPGSELAVRGRSIGLLANVLVGTVLVLTLLSGVQYLRAATFFRDEA